jgi:hypothetical protein
MKPTTNRYRDKTTDDDFVDYDERQKKVTKMLDHFFK